MKKPPNILLFITDDHGQWANRCYGNTELITPAFDRLAAEGVRFANAFTPCPVCSPARACLMTGRTPSQVGLHDYLEETDPEIGRRNWLKDEITLPELLAGAGYHCGLSGKRHLGRGFETPPGFHYYFGMPFLTGKHEGEEEYVFGNEIFKLSGNKSRFITDYALRFLDEVPADQPFFLNAGYIATHSPYHIEAHDPEMTALYAEATFDELDEYHPHPWHKNEGLCGEPPLTEEKIRSTRVGYYAAVTEIDREIGRLVSRLEEQGKLGNTIVLYTSDHGCSVGQQGFWGKGNSTRPFNMCETSIRVPLLLRWPERCPAGQVVRQSVDHYDTFQTLCGWAGVDLSAEKFASRAYPGRSYAPLAERGEIENWREARYGEYGDLRMNRRPDFKFVKRYPHGPHDLFDLRNDPDERLNRAGWDEFYPLQEEMEKEMEAWYAAHEDPAKSGLRVKDLPRHNNWAEAWRDGRRERRGLQVY